MKNNIKFQVNKGYNNDLPSYHFKAV